MIDNSGATYLVHLPDGSAFGPASLEDLRAWVQAGVVKPTTSIQAVGTEMRVPAAIVSGLFEPMFSNAQGQSVVPTSDSSPQSSEPSQHSETAREFSVDTGLESDEEETYEGPYTPPLREPMFPLTPSRARKLNRFLKWLVGIGLGAIVIWGLVSRLAPSGAEKKTVNPLESPGTSTTKITLGIGLSPIDNAASDAYGIPRGHGWLVTEVRGNAPPMLIEESFSNSQLEQYYRDVSSGRISPDAALEQALRNWEAIAKQMRATRDAMKLVERDADSGTGKWSVFGDTGRVSLGDMILSVDGKLVGPTVNDGNNMVGRAVAGRAPGYRYMIEGLRVSSESLNQALASPSAGAALKPEKFEAWFVVPSASESRSEQPASQLQVPAQRDERIETSPSYERYRRVWDPID